MNIQQIAQTAHEINRAYCQAIGDNSQPPWEEAEDWQRESAIKGVEYHLEHPEAGPDDSHNSWMEVKTAEGWTYGEVKDPAKKTHPCYLPYDQLPKEQKAKDYLFRQTVHSLRKFLGAAVETSNYPGNG